MPEEPSQQSWNPERYERNAGFVADLGAGVFDLLAPQPGERILDVGCGHGKLTEKITAAGAVVVAIDASYEQVEAARARGLDARVMDARELDFEKEFDAVFSNAALHWIKDADSVIQGIKKALVPGGRFVGEMGGEANCAGVLDGVAGAMDKRGLVIADFWPWYFPSVEDYQARLNKAGFRVPSIEIFERPTPIPGDIEGWFEVFGESFLGAVPEQDRTAFLDDIRDDLAPEFCDDEGNWSVDYVRLRFQAFLGDAL